MGWLPCCLLTDNSFCLEIEAPDVLAAKAVCEAIGGCAAQDNQFSELPGVCEGFDCETEDDNAIDVSCCDMLTGLCTEVSYPLCGSSFQRRLCPGDCSVFPVVECDRIANEVRVCCVIEECLLTTFAECVVLQGEYRNFETECTESCTVFCREPNESHTPVAGPEWGQKTYTLDLCYPAPMIRVRPPVIHNNPARRGRGVPMTAFEVRAVAQVQRIGFETDPCARAYGALARDENGRRRPYLCSQTDPNRPGSATYSQGYFSKALDNNGPILRGRRVRRAGVMTEPHREVQFYLKPLICGEIE